MPQETIVAPAVPYGTSAIAIIRVSGALSRQLINDIFQIKFEPRFQYFAKYLSLKNEILDEVLFTYFQSPASYTGEDVIEISTHGNPFIIKNILEDICDRGCRLAERGEFTKRAFLNKKFNLCQAEAVADIIHASNTRALKISQQQMAGGFNEHLSKINNNLLSTLALIETNIDFSDENIDSSTSSIDNLTTLIKATSDDIQSLINSNKYRDILFNGINTVIIGAPNTGKSSLLNTLLLNNRALVSDIPGTTRDFISETININNDILRIIDTAGLRLTPESTIEQHGIEKTIERAELADIYLLVVDSNKLLPSFPKNIYDLLTETNCIIIENKNDLERKISYNEKFRTFDKISTQLKTFEQSEKIKEFISNFLQKNSIVPDETSIIVNSRHSEILTRANVLLKKTLNIPTQHIECLASDIRTALEIIGEITGSYNTEDMLDKLFSTFCIGK